MGNIMRLSGIYRVFDNEEDELVALNDINLSIEEKEFVTVLGPVGCGKTTLIKIMAGILHPTLGELEFNGVRYQKGIPKSQLKNIGVVFQQNPMLEWRTVRQNLKLNLEIFKLKGKHWEKNIDEKLEMVGLKEYEQMYPFELSGGMVQRAGIARSMIHDPMLLLMDQPFGALDAITRKMLSLDVLDIWRKTQKTIVMVTNDIEEALLLSSRVVVMSDFGGIEHDIQNDVPPEARNEFIIKNDRFIELRMELNEIIHKSETACR